MNLINKNKFSFVIYKSMYYFNEIQNVLYVFIFYDAMN